MAFLQNNFRCLPIGSSKNLKDLIAGLHWRAESSRSFAAIRKKVCLRTLSTEGPGVCLRWADSKPVGPKGEKAHCTSLAAPQAVCQRMPTPNPFVPPPFVELYGQKGAYVLGPRKAVHLYFKMPTPNEFMNREESQRRITQAQVAALGR